MTWNNIKSVRDLEPYARNNDYEMVVALCIKKDISFVVNSYGRTRELCAIAASLNTQLADLVEDGTIAP